MSIGYEQMRGDGKWLTFLLTIQVVQLVEALHYKLEGHTFNSQCGHWDFSLPQTFQPNCGPGADSASNTNEYQDYLLGGGGGGGGGGGKGGWCIGLALPPSCANCLEILEASTSYSPYGLYTDCFTFTYLQVPV
jgi:hypothetical protein